MPFSKNDPNINRKGRPKKDMSLSTILYDELANLDVKTKEGTIKAKRGIARRLIELAMKGDVAAIRYCYDRIDGKPDQSLDITSNEEGIREIRFTFSGDKNEQTPEQEEDTED